MSPTALNTNIEFEQLEPGDELSISWATSRLKQKLLLADTLKSVNVQLQYLRWSIPTLLIWGVVLLSSAHFLDLGYWGLGLVAVGGLLCTIAIVFLIEDLVMLARHRTADPRSALETFFRAISRGRYDVAHKLTSRTDHTGLIRAVPDVEGYKETFDDLEVTFDNCDGFSTYWQQILSRPAGWEDSYHVLSWPIRWVTWRAFRVRQVNDRLVVVYGDGAVNYVPYWSVLSGLLGILPAFIMVPNQKRRARLMVKKALVLTNAGWQLLNGELLSEEDLAVAKMLEKA